MAETRPRIARLILNLHVSLFVLYLFLPLVVTAIAAVRVSPDPSTGDGKGFSLHGFAALFADDRLIGGLVASLAVAVAVVAVSLPLGLAGALVLRRLSRRTAAALFALLIVPLALPGLATALATLLFWRDLGADGGLALAVVARTGWTAALVMLLFLVRLQSLDPTLEDAAIDLGASPVLVARRILAPHLAPTAVTAAVVAFLAALGDHDSAVLALGRAATAVTEIGARLGGGTPALAAALAVALAAAALVAVALGLLARRRTTAAAPASTERSGF